MRWDVFVQSGDVPKDSITTTGDDLAYGRWSRDRGDLLVVPLDFQYLSLALHVEGL